MASALFKLSSDGGSTYLTAGTALADAAALAYNASGTYSIKAALDSTAGVDTVQWSITSADDVNIASLPAVTQNADKTCEFSVTKTGGAWLLRCIVNGGVNALTGKTDPALVRALAIKVLNSAGQQEVAVGESNEAGAYGWTKAINDALRTAGGSGLTESELRTVAAGLTASLDVNGQKIVDLGTPTASTDAATKASSEAAATAAAQDEANLRAAAAALTTDLDVNGVEVTNLANPTTNASAATAAYVLGQATDLIYDHGGSASGRVYTSLAAAVTAAASIDGLVRIWIKSTSGTPTTASGTYALGNRIELCGLSGGSPGTKVTLQLVTGAVFQNPCAFRNLELEHDLAAAWITSTGDVSVVFDNTNIIDNGATADIITLGAATSNHITFDNRCTYSNGGSGALCTLSSGKSLYLYVRDAIVGDNAVLGSAGTLRIYQGGSGSVPSQSGFSGTLSADVQDVVRQLGEARTAVDVNSQKITSLAVPTSDQDGVPRMHVNGYNDVSVAGSGSVSLSTADTDWYLVDLIGTLSGDRTVSLPNAQRSLLVRNGTTGTYTLRLTGSAGGFAYLAPGQVRRVYTNGTSLIGEALRVVEFETTVDLSSGYTVGDHDTTLFKVPAAFDVDRVEIRCTTSVGTGNAAVSVGVSGSYNQLVLSTAIATAGDVVGLDTAEAGADFTDKIAAHYSTAQTLTLRVTVTTATLTAGALRVMVVGRHVGE